MPEQVSVIASVEAVPVRVSRPIPFIAGNSFTLHEILTADPPPLIWAIHELITERGFVILSGEGGVGKSYILMEWALSLSLKKMVFGHFPVHRPYRVLYLDQEMDEGATIKRFQRMAAGYKISPEKAKQNDNLIIGSQSLLRLDVKELTEYLVEYVNDNKIDFVLVDSLGRALRGQENEVQTVNNFFYAVKPLRDRCNSGLIMLHHQRKKSAEDGMNDSSQRLRGSSAWRDVIDSHFAIIDKPKENYLTIAPDKNRHGDALAPRFTIYFHKDDPEEDDGPFTMKYEEDSFATANQETIFKLIPPKGSGGIRPKDLGIAAKGISRPTISRTLKTFLHEERIENVGTERWPMYEVCINQSEIVSPKDDTTQKG